MNSDDFFIAKENARRDEERAKLEREKEQRQVLCGSASAASIILQSLASRGKTPDDATVPELKTLVEWKFPNVAVSSKRKADLLSLYKDSPEPENPPGDVPWTDEDELKLRMLKQESVTLASTELGRQQKHMAKVTAAMFDKLEVADQELIERAFRDAACKRAAAATLQSTGHDTNTSS